MIVNGGLRIYSTMDRNLQNATQEILNDNKTYQVGNDLSKNISTEDIDIDLLNKLLNMGE